jgi:hypothetical protein
MARCASTAWSSGFAGESASNEATANGTAWEAGMWRLFRSASIERLRAMQSNQVRTLPRPTS